LKKIGCEGGDWIYLAENGSYDGFSWTR